MMSLYTNKGIKATDLVLNLYAEVYYAQNSGVDEDALLTLSNPGFDMEFIFFIEKIQYMFTKAHGVASLKEAIRLMFYKLNFSDEYDKVMENGD